MRYTELGSHYIGEADWPGTDDMFTIQELDGKVSVYNRPPGMKDAELGVNLHSAFIAPYDWPEGEEPIIAGVFPRFWLEAVG